jgi:outer membrane protein assembly factor BamB
MIGRITAVLILLAACMAVNIPSSSAATESSPWYQTNSNAAQSRANLTEKVLTPTAVNQVTYLRSVVSPPPQENCPQGIAAPVLVGGDLYVLTGGQLSKYNAATGQLIWNVTPDPTFTEYYESLTVSANLVIVGSSYCESVSSPSGSVYAFNASTGALAWSSPVPEDGPLNGTVVDNSYVITAGENAGGYEVSALNLSNGKPAWSHDDCGGGGAPSALPLVVGQLVISYGCNSAGNEIIEGNNLATGTIEWSLPGYWNLQRGDLDDSAGRHLYATTPGGLVVDLNALTGQETYTLSQAVNVLAVDRSRVYDGRIAVVIAPRVLDLYGLPGY